VYLFRLHTSFCFYVFAPSILHLQLPLQATARAQRGRFPAPVAASSASPRKLCTKISLCDVLLVRSASNIGREVLETSGAGWLHQRSARLRGSRTS
jgi:hypothetical protein